MNFGEIRPRESKPRSKYVWIQNVKGNKSYIYVDAMTLSETSPIKFVQIRFRESKPRTKFVWVQKAKGNESYIYVCRCCEAEQNKPQ